MYCPKCKEEIEHFAYEANYSEMEYGRSYGIADFNGDNREYSNSDHNDSRDWEEDDIEYFCPECNESLKEDELLESLNEADKTNEAVESADDFNKINAIK